MELQNLSKWIFFIGIGLIVLSLILFLLGKLSFPWGKLPGDISIKGEKSSFYFPVVSCILISILLTVLINLIFWFFRK